MLSFSVWIAAPQNEVRLNHVSSFFFNFYLLKGLENEKTLFFLLYYLRRISKSATSPIFNSYAADGVLGRLANATQSIFSIPRTTE